MAKPPRRPVLSDPELAAIMSALDDSRAVIAAGKAQRWDVVKWAFTVNVGLATAEVALPGSHGLLLIFAILVALVGGILAWHYNRRVSGARRIATNFFDELAKHGIDILSIENDPRRHRLRSSVYDLEEIVTFAGIILLSLVPPAVAFLCQA